MDPDVEASLKPLLDGYPVVITIPVLWGDQDAFHHVNNVVYFRWYETGRIEYSRRVGLLTPNSTDPVGTILAATSNNYRRQIVEPDTVHVALRVARIGRSSVSLEHIVVSQAQCAIAAEGTSTIVAFDYRENRTIPVPDAIRRAIEELEGKSF